MILGHNNEITISRSRCIGNFLDVLATSQFCYDFFGKMTWEKAKTWCNSNLNHKSALVTFDTQDELRYVGLKAHVGKVDPVGVWTGYRRENGK